MQWIPDLEFINDSWVLENFKQGTNGINRNNREKNVKDTVEIKVAGLNM